MKKLTILIYVLTLTGMVYADRSVPSHQDGGGTSDLKNFRVVGPIYIINATHGIFENAGAEIVDITSVLSVTNTINLIGTGSNHPRFNFWNGEGNIGFILLALQNNAGFAGSAPNDMIIKNASSNALRFGTNSTERFTILGNGYTGFGAVNPQKNLHAHKSSSGEIFLLFTNATTGSSASSGWQYGVDQNEKGSIWGFGNYPFYLGVNNMTAFTLDSNLIAKFWGPEVHIDRAGVGDGFFKSTASTGYDTGFDFCEGSTDGLNWRAFVDGDDSDKFKMIDSASQPIVTFTNSGNIVFNATNGLTAKAEGTNYSIIYNKQFYDNGVHAPVYRTVKGRGTESSPSQIKDHDILSIQQVAGYNNTPELVNAGQLVWYATGDWTATNEGCVLYVQPTGYGNYNRTTIAGFYGEGVAIGGGGVGDTDNYELFVTGNIAYTGTCGAPSSRITKREIKPLTDPEKENLLNELDSLELQSFKYRTPKEKSINDFENTIEAFQVKDFVDFYVYDEVTDSTKNVPIEVSRMENRVTQTRAEKLEKYNARREAAQTARHYTITRTGVMTDDLPPDSPMFFERKNGRRDLSLDGTAQQTISYVKLIREEQLRDRERINTLEAKNRELLKRIEALETKMTNGGRNE